VEVRTMPNDGHPFLDWERDGWVNPALTLAVTVLDHATISTSPSISTGMLKGSSASPTALRA
jgi:hypothetical protein